MPKAGCQFGVPSPALFWALCQGILKIQSSFQFKAEPELHEPSLARTMFLWLPCPFHSPVRDCICLSLSHCAPPPGLGILMFLKKCIKFPTPELLLAQGKLTGSDLRLFAKPVKTHLSRRLQQQISQLRLKGNSMPSSF